MIAAELPLLPEPYCREYREPRERYTAEQMRAYASQAVAAEREPFAWATLCDAALHSLSHTERSAEIRAEMLREENRGRGFHVEVVPLYR